STPYQTHQFVASETSNISLSAPSSSLTTTPLHPPIRLAIFGSGKGSNFLAIYDAIQAGKLPATILIVVSDNPNARIIDLAKERNLPTLLVEEHRYKSRLSENVESELAQKLLNLNIELIALAGWMRIVKYPLLQAFPNRILNIHPSLLPQFPGLEAWRQALLAGAKITGCTVHLVNEGIDSGPILAQTQVPILPNDSPESLHARIQEAEHLLYPQTIASYCSYLRNNPS
ncbi:MAG: phosphoribosylglycinamide formyltransferase, partial [Chthoniobacterales bacterium]|nr:phosphoribosylglycinamide formyltransferase [Chthoniobacterales bacterium]